MKKTMILPLFGMIRKNQIIQIYTIKEYNCKTKIVSFNEIATFVIDNFKLHKIATETVMVFCMMMDGTPIGICEIAKGSNKNCQASINTLSKYLLLTGADRFVLIHNHPNNDCNPSIDDILITNKVREMSSFFEIEFDEHLIICRNGFYGMLNKRRVNI